MQPTEEQVIYIRVSRAAHMLGVSVGLVYQLLRSGQLRGINIMGARRVDERSVREFIARNATGPVDPAPQEVKAEEVVTQPQTPGRPPKKGGRKK